MSEERWCEYLKLVYSDTLTEKDMERMFLVNPADAFAIYQLRDHESTHDLRFLPMSQLLAAGLTVERDNYAAVYTGNLYNTEAKASAGLTRNIRSISFSVRVSL